MTEYYGYGFPNKRWYSLKSLLLYYNNNDENMKNLAREHLIKDISKNLGALTKEQWNNTEGLKLIDLDNLGTVEDIIKTLAKWASSEDNINNLEIEIKFHSKFTNVERMILYYHKTKPKDPKKEIEKMIKNNPQCSKDLILTVIKEYETYKNKISHKSKSKKSKSKVVCKDRTKSKCDNAPKSCKWSKKTKKCSKK